MAYIQRYIQQRKKQLTVEEKNTIVCSADRQTGLWGKKYTGFKKCCMQYRYRETDISLIIAVSCTHYSHVTYCRLYIARQRDDHFFWTMFLNLHTYIRGLNSRKLDTQKPHGSVLCVHAQPALFCIHRFQLPRQPCLEDFKLGFNIWRLLCLSTVKKEDYWLEKHSTFSVEYLVTYLCHCIWM